MAPCDPYTDPNEHIIEPIIELSVHEKLVSYLAYKESPPTFQSNVEGRASFSQLPTEMVEHVFSYIGSKNDLAQICKVNSRCFATALPFLYRKLRVCLKAELDPLLAQMFTLENTGLRYVRQIAVSTEASYHQRPKAAHQWLWVLVNQIAKDTLSRFRWETPYPLPACILSLLWQRQRNLEGLEITPRFDSDSRAWAEAARADQDIDLMTVLNRVQFGNLKKIRVAPDNPETALLACAGLQCGAVTELEVDGRLWEEGDAEQNEDNEDSDEGHEDDDEEYTVNDRLTECLFDHLDRVKPGCVPKHDILTTLTLKDINLTLCKHTWFTYIDLCHLRHLRLEHCAGPDLFLMRLASGAATPGLYSLTLLHDLGTNADRTIHAVDDLLSFPRNKLRKLELCLRNSTELPKVASITAHSRTLRKLLIDVTGKGESQSQGWDNPPMDIPRNPSLFYSTNDFAFIVQSCSSLVELGTAVPSTDMKYKNFSNGEDFSDWIDLIVTNLKLTTLNVLNWPKDYKHGRDDGYYAAKNLELARLASDIFARHRSYDHRHERFANISRKPTLEVVAFGVREHGDDSPSPTYFVQSEVKVWGKTHLHAQRVNLKELENQNLDLQVLNYDPRDFEETSRKSFSASRRWSAVHVDQPEDGW